MSVDLALAIQINQHFRGGLHHRLSVVVRVCDFQPIGREFKPGTGYNLSYLETIAFVSPSVIFVRLHRISRKWQFYRFNDHDFFQLNVISYFELFGNSVTKIRLHSPVGI